MVQDNEEQAATAQALLLRATVIAVPVLVFCEFAWVLRRGYACAADDVAAATEAVAGIEAVVTDRPAVRAGLAALRSGGDFADGVIAYQGEGLGGTVFASFDRSAVARLRNAGAAAADPSSLLSPR